MVTQMQGADTRLVNYSSQLNSRYETLKANMRDLVKRWGDYVHDHQNYQSNYSQCTEWVATLKKRQEVRKVYEKKSILLSVKLKTFIESGNALY